MISANPQGRSHGHSLILAHRGDHKEAPENSLAAFRTLGVLGVDGVELDVQLTADNVPIVVHKSAIGGLRFDALELDSVRELQGELAAEEDLRIPTLQEVLTVLADGIVVNLELKCSEVVPPLASLVRDAHKRCRLVVTSFHTKALLAVRREAPEVTTGLVSSLHVSDQLSPVREAQADVLSLYWPLATPALVGRLQDGGVAVYVWTVNSDAALQHMLELGVDAIITDEPRRALERARRR